ncbi:MAG: L,D-transpeptidase [Candidatus Omnitrophota bacterium]|nr:L,D-transpeptidase [Candidatus Omnitrophota bacterium]MBU1928934.1 L,D-transpeptidase [Candidatus Omnitrophota bacterium]MBU2035341.1 L,D-transpeptidase [Candidatus Omnitrophota bacterium]MBU2222140.1 L,D-transpeptidase [Candidatus Omnitrophota bacterium]MBU2257639.1 L,D-transpeptidase [Candidatus Omnitrophota bacterium]
MLKELSDCIIVRISQQKLYLFSRGQVIKTYPISTSKYGIGNKSGSNKTPIGLHQIVSKIGRDASLGSIFKRRRNTGKRASLRGGGDLITTRILRLAGFEKGINKGKGIDSFARCIYIHGTPGEDLIGTPASHGCIRMKNRDIIELFDLVKNGIIVKIAK